MTVGHVIPFGEWLPDLPAHQNPGALIARNVIPEAGGYRSLNSPEAFTNALASACLGTFWLQASDGTVYTFAGTSTGLHRLTDVTWNDVSGSSAPYNAVEWEFTKFGDRVIAANIGDPLQAFDIGTDTVFKDLPGGPPQAARIATVRDFVVIGDIAGLGPHWVQWCGFNNSEIWTPSLATQSDRSELFGRGGRVMRIVPGEYGVIFQEHSITRMDYTGPPVIFQIDEVERKRGTPAPGSVLWTGRHVFFFGWDGFYHFDGRGTESISHNRVSRWFERNADGASFTKMRGAVDRVNRLLIWAFSNDASSPFNDRLLIYNWAANRWSYAEVDTEIIDEYVSPGYTLDELDLVLGNIDDNSISVDSTAYQGGDINLQVFTPEHRTATFSGEPLPATIDTKEISSQRGTGLFCNAVEPQVESNENPTIRIRVGTRRRLADVPSFTTARAVNGINGEVNVRVNSRYMRFRAEIAGRFEHATGVLAHIADRRARR